MNTRKRLGELLVEAGRLTQEQLAGALAEQKKQDLKLGEYLIRKGIVRESALMDTVSEQLHIPRFKPEAYPVDMSSAALVPADFARQYKVVPLQVTPHLLTVAMVDPMDIEAVDTLEIDSNREVEAVICSEQEFNQLFSRTYGMTHGLDNVLEDIKEMEISSEETQSASSDDVRISSLEGMAEEVPVVRLVNSIISQAIRENASDIHISPEKDYVQVRFRIDGTLHEVPAPPKRMFTAIASRIKILGNMDIATTRVPLDGRFTVNMDNREINVRVSSLPTIYGENLVLRLLDMSSSGYDLDQLGIQGDDADKIHSIISKPYGMILTSGPTGSGKTTTLYGILKEINTPDINIVTLEDPVEYRIEKIRQVQLNKRAGMTFASGLRSILRQDPDVIMVGEIRDHETASIAVQAALTGHRMLSTLHTNDAAGTVTRFMDMGVEPYLLASVLLASIAQRLVRKICPHCKEAYTPEDNLLRYWKLEDSGGTFYRGTGCPSCNGTGFRGRVGIFEILINDEDVQNMILRNESAQAITRAMHTKGKLRTLYEDARNKVLMGLTTLEEATRVIMS